MTNSTADPITETLTNTTDAPVVVTYVITATANGCTNPTTFNYVVTVNPTATISSAGSATVCNNTPQNYDITSNVSGTTYTWTRVAVTGISNAAVTNSASDPITETLTNTTDAPVVVTYVITATANGCTNPTTFNYVVTVNPTATISSAGSATVCNNTQQNYDITSNVSGTTYTWTRVAVTGISNAAVTNSASDPITETLTNTTDAPVVVTYVITATANGCTNPTMFNYVVTVNPTATISSAASATICNNTPQNYDITSNVAGISYTWTRVAVTGISNAAVTNSTADPITETLTNTTDAPVVVTYVITATANGCTNPATFNYVVTVNPTATISSAGAATVCNNTPQNYDITSNVSGTTYTWTRVAVTGISNAAVTNSASDPITETLTNTTDAPVVVTYVITATANGCTNPTTFNYVVTVNPTATISSAGSATVCNNTQQNYDITSNVSGTTYTWTRLAVTGISNAAVTNSTADPITETLTNTTDAPVVVTYVITATANGCTNPTTFNYVVTVNPTATISSAGSATVCNNTQQNYDITSNVSGTTYTWTR
ncbi:PKD-like domain-containing protein, partial [Microcoleus sp. SVA1_A1]|uniref:PKD-like domain-containing protein n=1 Tax=Microcoleus sp. SVA1_A1 TaxID=2818946 RepID=UPI002FD5D3EB